MALTFFWIFLCVAALITLLHGILGKDKVPLWPAVACLIGCCLCLVGTPTK